MNNQPIKILMMISGFGYAGFGIVALSFIAVPLFRGESIVVDDLLTYVIISSHFLPLGIGIIYVTIGTFRRDSLYVWVMKMWFWMPMLIWFIISILAILALSIAYNPPYALGSLVLVYFLIFMLMVHYAIFHDDTRIRNHVTRRYIAVAVDDVYWINGVNVLVDANRTIVPGTIELRGLHREWISDHIYVVRGKTFRFLVATYVPSPGYTVLFYVRYKDAYKMTRFGINAYESFDGEANAKHFEAARLERLPTLCGERDGVYYDQAKTIRFRILEDQNGSFAYELNELSLKPEIQFDGTVGYWQTYLRSGDRFPDAEAAEAAILPILKEINAMPATDEPND